MDFSFNKKENFRQLAFVAYVCAGDPTFQKSLGILETLAEKGVDMIELGIPFSDPVADGPTNQAAAKRALNAGMTTQGVLDLTREFRKKYSTPIIYFSYLNPLFCYGIEKFQKEAVKAGANGILLLDEAEGNTFLPESNFPQIRIISPTTPAERVRKICSEAKGFIYLLSRTGVTGKASEVTESLKEKIQEIKKVCSTPLYVGFGIQTPEQVESLKAKADGVIVGSFIGEIIERYAESPELYSQIGKQIAPILEACQRK